MGAVMRDLDRFTTAYLEAALWTTMGDDDTPLDVEYGIEDIAPDALEQCVRECARFQAENADDLGAGTPEEGGRDFWLTRNGHGTGFWDGDWPESEGLRLTSEAERAGQRDLYVGDDGRLYIFPVREG